MADNTSNRGLGSPNMSESKKHEIQSKGGKASGGGTSHSSSNTSGAAGRTEAAKRGGENSHRNR